MNLPRTTRLAWILALGASLSATAQLSPDLEGKLAAAAAALRATLTEKNPDGKELTVATVPLVDAEQNIRKVGVVIAQAVERHLLNGKPEWLRLQSRLNLASVMTEQKLWITDMVKHSDKENSAPAGFLEKADFLVVGIIAPGNDQLGIELRLIGTRNGNVLAAQTLGTPATDPIRAGYRPLQRRDGKETSDIAVVDTITLSVAAQREGAPGTPVKEWPVKEGETLKGGKDQFNIRFSVDADACAYVFLVGSDQQAALLFPTDDWEAQFERQFGRKAKKIDNYCRADLEYIVPGPDASGQPRFFKLDTLAGANVLYVCASRQAVPDFQDIAARLSKAATDEARRKLLTENFKIDCVKSFTFNQD